MAAASGTLVTHRAKTGEFIMEQAWVASRGELTNATSADWQKIHAKFASGDLLQEQSAAADYNDDGTKEHFIDMMDAAAIDGTAERNITCPMFFINFMVERRRVNNRVPEDLLFGVYDGTTMFPVDQSFVSDQLRELKLIGSYKNRGSDGQALPKPASLEQTLSQKVGDNFTPWKKTMQKMPQDFQVRPRCNQTICKSWNFPQGH